MALIQPRIDQLLERAPDLAQQETFFVKRLGGFGDVIMALGAMNALRKARPNALIHFLTEDRFAPLARLCPFLDKVYTDAKDFMLAVQEFSNNRGKVILCDWTYALFGINREHQIDAFLKSSGFYAPSADKEAILRFEPEAATALRSKVATLLGNAPGRKILLHPSRGDSNRTWPLEHWNRLIDLILGHGDTPVLVGDNSSIPFKGVLKPSPRPGLLDLTNRLSFLELIALCWQADVFVSPDSGPVQVAGTTEIALVALYTTVPARCRLPFRSGYHMWKAIGLEPDCPHKGCYQVLIPKGPWRDKLQEAFRRDFVRPGSQATNKFMGEFCVLEEGSKFSCLANITPERVWGACQHLMDTNFEDLSKTVASAQEALHQGRAAEAVLLFQTTLDAYHLPDLKLDLASALILAGDIPGALQVLDALLEVHPSTDVFNLMAVATYLQDDAEEAERLGELAVSWNPQNLAAQANLALFRAHHAFESRDYLAGLFALETHFTHREQVPLEHRPRLLAEETAHILKGYLTIGLSQSTQAVDSFDAAARLNPESILAAFGLGEAHLLAGSVALAHQWYERALEIDPSFQPAADKLQGLASLSEPPLEMGT